MAYRPGPFPLDPSQVTAYIVEELGKIAKEVGSYDLVEYRPTWTGATTNPVLGNGSLRALYRLTDDLCELWLWLLIGSTTTFGSGEWRFQLPAAASKIDQIGIAHFHDASATRVTGNCKVNAAGNLLRLYGHGSLGGVSSSIPFTWATDDQLYAHIRYFR